MVHRDDSAVIASVTASLRTVFNMTHTFPPNEKLIKKFPSQMQPEKTFLEPKTGERKYIQSIYREWCSCGFISMSAVENLGRNRHMDIFIYY